MLFAYRSLYRLDIVGKLSEKFMRSKLDEPIGWMHAAVDLALVTFDFRNAFNFRIWANVLSTLYIYFHVLHSTRRY